MTRRAACVAVLMVAACTSTADPVSTTTSDLCKALPADELESVSEFELDLDPNPVDAGSEATLSVTFDEEPPSDHIGGAGASWECWDGSGWIETHILVRAFNDTAQASVIDLSKGSEAVPDIGLNIPNSYQVLIPSVGPGTYRITDRIFGPQSTLTAHVTVEVTG